MKSKLSDEKSHDLNGVFVGHWTYTHTIRRPEIKCESPELKMQISSKEYKVRAFSINLISDSTKACLSDVTRLYSVEQ